MPSVTANNDGYTLPHVYTLTGTVNGSSGTYGVLHNDSGSGIAVSAVGGSSANVGQPISASSGSTLTLNADGSFTYEWGGCNLISDVFSYEIFNGSASDSAYITFTVANNLPTIASIGGKSAFVGDSVSFAVSASDADSDTLTFSATGLPDGLSINSSTGVISGTVSTSASTTEPFEVTVTVTDEFTGSDSDLFEFTISSAYVVVAQGDQYNVAGVTVEVSLYSWKVTGHTLSYSATGLPAGLSINSSTGVISGTIEHGEESEEPYEVTITATDSAGDGEGEVTFDWYVDAPIIRVFAPESLESVNGAEVEFAIAGWASEGAELTYSATGLPGGLTIDEETGLISGSIDSNASTYSPYSVTITVINESAEIEEYASFSWSVSNLVLKNPGWQQNLVGSSPTLNLESSYSGNGSLVFTASQLPTGISINSSTGVISGTIASNASIAEPYEVTVSVSDGTNSSTKTFLWDIKKLFLADPGDQFAFEGDNASLELDFTKISGNSVVFTISDEPDGLSINSSTGEVTWNIPDGAHENGPYTFTITATDTDAEVSASKTITWTVYDRANPPRFFIPVPFPPFAALPPAVGESEENWLLRNRNYANFQLQVLTVNYDTQAAYITNVVIPEVTAIVVANPAGFLADPAFVDGVFEIANLSARNVQRLAGIRALESYIFRVDVYLRLTFGGRLY